MLVKDYVAGRYYRAVFRTDMTLIKVLDTTEGIASVRCLVLIDRGLTLNPPQERVLSLIAGHFHRCKKNGEWYSLSKGQKDASRLNLLEGRLLALQTQARRIKQEYESLGITIPDLERFIRITLLGAKEVRDIKYATKRRATSEKKIRD